MAKGIIFLKDDTEINFETPLSNHETAREFYNRLSNCTKFMFISNTFIPVKLVKFIKFESEQKDNFNFYEVYDPYYALIKAKSLDEAKELYIKNVADDEEGILNKEITKVPNDYAIARYSRAVGEGKEQVPLNEILDDLRSKESMLLIINGNLL